MSLIGQIDRYMKMGIGNYDCQEICTLCYDHSDKDVIEAIDYLFRARQEHDTRSMLTYLYTESSTMSDNVSSHLRDTIEKMFAESTD